MMVIRLTSLFLVLSAISIQESHGTMTLNVSGIVASAFTPFYDNGLVNYDLIPELAQLYKDTGIENVLLISYSGEGPLLSLAEDKAIVKTWVDAGTPLGLKFIVQVGGQPLFETVQLTRYCSELKVAGIIALPVITYKGDLDEVINDLQIISNAAPDLAMLYEDLTFVTTPQVTTADVYAAAKKQICNFAGVMTSMDTALQIKAFQSLEGMTVMIIRQDEVAAAFAANFNISVSAAGNLFPKQVLAIEAAYRNNNYEEGQAQQAELNSLFATLNTRNGSVTDYTARYYLENQKEAFRLIWNKNLGIRIPLVRPAPAETRQIAKGLQRLGVNLKGSP